MAFLKLYRKKLKDNYDFLQKLFAKHDISWGIVSKLLCGNKIYIHELINLGIREIHDSRVSNLKMVKTINPAVRTIYIKPPSKRNIPAVVQTADVSLNTEYHTLAWLSEEAAKQNKIHQVIIMVETGDLREGVMGDRLVSFYERVFRLPNIEIIGLGTNLNCMSGVMPTADKLIQLCLYRQIIELKFNRKIPLVSAGTSVMIPLLQQKILPKGINHFRVGETLFFGNNLFDETQIKGMHDDVFELFVEIIEIREKPVVPQGELSSTPSGEVFVVDETMYGKKSHRAIIDIGLLDVNPKYLIPEDKEIHIVGGSSDMLVLDVGQNPRNLKVGDLLRFKLKYMGALTIMSSSYVEKKVE